MTTQPTDADVITDIDHLMIASFDHDRAIKNYTNLGFKVRPVRQLAPMGGGSAGGNGGSAAILLRARTPGCANYLELAMADPVTAMPMMQDILRNDEGPAMLVHATLDPNRLADQWAKLGIKLERVKLSLPPFGAGPPVDLEVFLVPKGQAPFAFNACHYSSTYDFERDEWRNHPNGALHWTGLTVAVDDLSFAVSVKRFSEIYARQPRDAESCRAVFQLGATRLELWERTAFEREYGKEAAGTAVHIAVRSLADLRAYLAEKQIEYVATGPTVRVERRFANGTFLAFEEIEA
ncbi:MAG: VOC family protein [Sphingopyxis sp.]|nr:VOC family protein [Sphingopyxis sp.]